jgi:hypothetical protein
MNTADRELMQAILEAMEDLHRTGDTQVFDLYAAPELIPALRERLAHCDRCSKKLGGEGDIHTCTPRLDQGQDYERGFIDGMSRQAQSSVDRAVNRMAQPEQEPVAWMVYTQDGKSVYVTDNPTDIQEGQRALPLYTTPPAAQHQAAERNKLAAWMIAQGYATGHGDTMEGLLEELRWQVSESEREACADIAENWNCNGSPRLGVAAQIRARGHSMDRREEYEQGRQAS